MRYLLIIGLVCLGLVAHGQQRGHQGRLNPCACGMYCDCDANKLCRPNAKPGNGMCQPSNPIAAVIGVPGVIASRIK